MDQALSTLLAQTGVLCLTVASLLTDILANGVNMSVTSPGLLTDIYREREREPVTF